MISPKNKNNESILIYAKNKKPLRIIKGEVSSKNAVRKLKKMIMRVLVLKRTFVKIKKCVSTMIKSPKAKMWGNSILSTPV